MPTLKEIDDSHEWHDDPIELSHDCSLLLRIDMILDIQIIARFLCIPLIIHYPLLGDLLRHGDRK
jgi:hypothetical protein